MRIYNSNNRVEFWARVRHITSEEGLEPFNRELNRKKYPSICNINGSPKFLRAVTEIHLYKHKPSDNYDDFIGKGAALCVDKDQFNKKIGVFIAVGRCLKKLFGRKLKKKVVRNGFGKETRYYVV